MRSVSIVYSVVLCCAYSITAHSEVPVPDLKPSSESLVYTQAQGLPAEQPSAAAPPAAQNPQSQAAEAPELPPVRVDQGPGASRQPAKPSKIVERRAPAATRLALAPELPADVAPASVQLSPLAGSEVPVAKVAGAVNTVSVQDIARTGSSAIEDALQRSVPGAILSDQQGNAFQTNLEYRGFEASPVSGVPQGLAVYQNGVRINEVFGDTVNWDFLPTNAIGGITVLSGNPLFGLNALGGAVSVKMKDGFGFQGVESDTRFGSFGRRQEGLEGGASTGNVSAYVAFESIHDDGWRDRSPAYIHRGYADLGFKGQSESEFHINYTAASNFVGALAPSPVELLAQDRTNVFTSPQTTLNRLSMTSVNGTVGLPDNWKVSGVGYYRKFRQKHVDGNLSNAQACDPVSADAGFVCLDGDPLVNSAGDNARSAAFPDPIGEIDRTRETADSYGGAVQATNTARLFGFGNQFTLGTSIDRGRANTTSNAELGTVDLNSYVVTGGGYFPNGPLGITPTNLVSTTNYYGAFFIDTLDLTDRLSVTAGGRYNYADIALDDQTAAFKAAAFGPDTSLSSDHVFVRFNPSLGATYKLTRETSLYAGYSEASRAPTPAELGCANPAQPCLLQNFLVSDPSLKQVVSHTWETGLRGGSGAQRRDGRVDWSLGLFHTLNTDDIINAISPAQSTRGFFQNAGNTLRRGIEAKVSYALPDVTVYGTYALIDATYQSDLTLSSPNNPANADQNNGFLLAVHSGDHLPAVPQHRIKAGFDYILAEDWHAGADVVYASSQYFVGDANNKNTQVTDYAVVNLHTSYDITKHIQIYGVVNNLFDNSYSLYGVYFQSQQVALNDPRSETPAAPLSVYGGVKIKF